MTKNNTQKTILINGLGYSGSSALFDYIKEFDNTFMFEHEFDILRHSGGIFELEQTIKSQNIFLIDSGVKKFLRLVEYLNRTSVKLKEGRGYEQILGNSFKESAYKFIYNILLIESDTSNRDFNKHELDDNSKCLKKIIKKYGWIVSKKIKSKIDFHDDNKIYYAKDLSEREFVGYAKEFINDVLKIGRKKEFLVLDQAICIGSENFCDNLKYFRNPIALLVYRDPRDMYMEALSKDWMPTDTLEDFINWIKCMFKPMKANDKNLLKVRFEDLVLDYNNTTKLVDEFIGFNKKNHTNCREFFNPDISCKNVGLWKQFEDQKLMKTIEKEFPEFCYD